MRKELEDILGSTPELETLVELMLTTEKVVCGQRFRHNGYEKSPRRGAGAQKGEETNNTGFP